MIKVGAQMILEFGKGDIRIDVNMGKLNDNKVGFITFNGIEKGIVGRELDNKNQSIEDIFSNPVVLQFRNKQGIDVLIASLEKMKKNFDNEPKTLN